MGEGRADFRVVEEIIKRIVGVTVNG